MTDIENDNGTETVVPSIDYPEAKAEELDALTTQARADAIAGTAAIYEWGQCVAASLHSEEHTFACPSSVELSNRLTRFRGLVRIGFVYAAVQSDPVSRARVPSAIQ